MRVLSPEFPRYLSHSINIPSNAQCPELDHDQTIGMCTAGLPGIDNVNLASHTMREGKSRSWWSRGASKLKKPTQDALARTVTEGQQVQHGSACTDASGASGFTTVSGEVRGAAAGAGIGCSQSSCVFSHRPPASPRTVLRRPEQVCLREPQVQFLGLAWTGRVLNRKSQVPGSASLRGAVTVVAR